MSDVTNNIHRPWRIETVIYCIENGGIEVTGHNAENGGPFNWQLSHHCFADPEFVSRKYEFRGAIWTVKARAAFRELVEQAKARRTAPRLYGPEVEPARR